MGARAVSPGAALLRSSRLFSIPKPLPEPQATNLHGSGKKSDTMTRPYPQRQSITSPLSSREKGDWGFKRPFPLKSTLATSTPLIRVKQVDSVESVTDFLSAADYTVSLEKFQELRVALSVPQSVDLKDSYRKSSPWSTSVFEEYHDFTHLKHGRKGERAARKGQAFPKESSQTPDTWFKSIFEECTGLTYPKPSEQQGLDEQGANSADLQNAGQDEVSPMQETAAIDPADLNDAAQKEGAFTQETAAIDPADLNDAAQNEGAFTQETAAIDSADLGLDFEQAEGEAKPAAMDPVDQQQGLTADGLDSAALRGNRRQGEDLKDGLQFTDLERADQPEAALVQDATSAATISSGQQEKVPKTGTRANHQKPNQPDAPSEQEVLFKRRWKFQGPWLARMTQGEFNKYLEKQVRPRRAEFRVLLMDKLAKELTARQNNDALERGLPPSPPVEPKNITKEQFTEFLRTMRYDRIILYDAISRFLDIAPLAHPLSRVMESVQSKPGLSPNDESPYGRTGPPPSHPSAGISYLRTNAFMENHPIYGPQSHRAPALARVVSPRMGAAPAKLGVGGFVADTPAGDNEFNLRYGRQRTGAKAMLAGITYLDTTTYGGAKAYVEPHTASVDPSGRVVLQLQETGQEAPLIMKEANGSCTIYDDSVLDRFVPGESSKQQQPAINKVSSNFQADMMADRIMGQILQPNARDQGEMDGSRTTRV